jgi:hypothetical protein
VADVAPGTESDGAPDGSGGDETDGEPAVETEKE